MRPTPSLIKFPCDFIVKVIGKKDSSIEQDLLSILQQCAPTQNITLQKRDSRDHHFIAITFSIYTYSQTEIDVLYQTIQQCENIILAL